VSDDDLYKNIKQIKERWRFVPKGKRKRRADVLIDAIEHHGTLKGSQRGLKQIQLNEAYDNAVNKLINLANIAPDELFPKLYNLVIKFSEILYDEQYRLEDAFINPKRYKEIRKGNFLSKINMEQFSDALYYGCKTAMMYEIKQIKQQYSNFKGRTATEFLRIVATAKELNLTPQQAKGYLYALTGERYNTNRIKKLYEKII
jgi:hypothetical protein